MREKDRKVTFSGWAMIKPAWQKNESLNPVIIAISFDSRGANSLLAEPPSHIHPSHNLYIFFLTLIPLGILFLRNVQFSLVRIWSMSGACYNKKERERLGVEKTVKVREWEDSDSYIPHRS